MYTTVQALDNTFTLISSVHLFWYVPFILQNATFDMVGDSCDATCTLCSTQSDDSVKIVETILPWLRFPDLL